MNAVPFSGEQSAMKASSPSESGLRHLLLSSHTSSGTVPKMFVLRMLILSVFVRYIEMVTTGCFIGILEG
jgi:hypothetical protein